MFCQQQLSFLVPYSHPITWQKCSQKNADHGETSDAKSVDALFSAFEISTQVFAKEIGLVSNKQVWAVRWMSDLLNRLWRGAERTEKFSSGPHWSYINQSAKERSGKTESASLLLMHIADTHTFCIISNLQYKRGHNVF